MWRSLLRKKTCRPRRNAPELTTIVQVQIWHLCFLSLFFPFFFRNFYSPLVSLVDSSLSEARTLLSGGDISISRSDECNAGNVARRNRFASLLTMLAQRSPPAFTTLVPRRFADSPPSANYRPFCAHSLTSSHYYSQKLCFLPAGLPGADRLAADDSKRRALPWHAPHVLAIYIFSRNNDSFFA